MCRSGDIAYAAGLYEGEGSVGSHNGPPRMQVKMTDREPLARLLATFGGKIYGPRHRPDRKPIYEWTIAGWIPVISAFEELRPLLSPRRIAQFEVAFAAVAPERRGCGSYNRIKTHCKRGHEFTKENTRLYRGRRHCRQCVHDRRAEGLV